MHLHAYKPCRVHTLVGVPRNSKGSLNGSLEVSCMSECLLLPPVPVHSIVCEAARMYGPG